MEEPSPPQHTLPQPPETTFESRDNLVNYVRGWAKAQGYPVSIHKSDKVKVTFICIKGGPVRKRVDDTIRQRKRSSRKIGCMFKATARLSNKDEKWHLTITNASHNHPAEQNEASAAPQQHQEPEPVNIGDTGNPNDTLMGGTAADLGLLDGEGLTSPSTLEVVMRYPSSDLAGRVMQLENSRRSEDNTLRELRAQNRLLAEQNSLLKAQLETVKMQTEIISRQPDLSPFLNSFAPGGVRVLLEYYLVTKCMYDGSQGVVEFVSGERLLQISPDLNVDLEKCHQIFYASFPFGHDKVHETTLFNIMLAIRLSDDADILHQVFRRCFGENPAVFGPEAHRRHISDIYQYYANQDHIVRSLPHPEFTPLRVMNKHIHPQPQQHYAPNGYPRHPHTLASHRMGHPHGVRMGN